MSSLPRRVEFHEEGPREGFQMEKGSFPLADRLGPAAAADARQGGRGERGVLEAAVHALGVLPGQQHLGGRAGAHRQLRPDRDRVAQAAGALGGGHADADLALAAPQLGGLAGDVAQSRQHRAGGGQQAVLAGGSGERVARRARKAWPRAATSRPGNGMGQSRILVVARRRRHAETGQLKNP